MGPKHVTKLPERNLDVLRAIAVLLVVLSHTLRLFHPDLGLGIHALMLGRLGVLFFFTHTACVLMASLERMERRQRRHVAWRFYVRRAFRIYPLAWAAVAIFLLAHVPATWDNFRFPGAFQPATLGTLAANLGLSQNLFGARDLIGPLWTLPLELQMYAVLPVCYIAAKRGIRSTLGVLSAAVVIGALYSEFAHSQWSRATLGTSTVAEMAKVSMFGVCFVAGVLVYAIRRHRPSWAVIPSRAFPLGLGFAVVIFLVSSTTRLGGDTGAAWLPCLALAIIIPCVRERSPGAVSTAAAHIARYSYGTYLLHTAALWWSFHTLAASPSVVQWTVFVALLAGMPVLSYYALEAPATRLGAKLSDGRRGTELRAVVDVAAP